ncbi:MAG: DnaA regulatory inactivator Hda [Thermomonas sp.]|uniref:DnaA regulatory inactivator Hda n=1 Tax=Thermomonas sp. TaxID=1971895 RepID=UPI001D74D2E5|nr:DnaA regulatory inactivator Hda [Thermomonas sp.]MBZ0087396.1 DnaA regulatory inactivator Hda [Thermomonas sp.]
MTPPDVEAIGSQLPLALRAPPDQRFERFVAAPTGLLDQLRALALGRHVDPIFLSGPHSSGKTHLLLAACAEAEAAGRRTVYLSLRGLRGRVGEALQDVAAELVALDDLDAVAGERIDEIALFDHHNAQRDAGRGSLYAAIEAPDALPLALPDLHSRLAQCARWQLPTLDDAGRARMLRARATARGLDFDAAALDWMLQRCSRDPGSLAALFERLDHASLVAKRRLTVPFLRQVLGPELG